MRSDFKYPGFNLPFKRNKITSSFLSQSKGIIFIKSDFYRIKIFIHFIKNNIIIEKSFKNTWNYLAIERINYEIQ